MKLRPVQEQLLHALSVIEAEFRDDQQSNRVLGVLAHLHGILQKAFIEGRDLTDASTPTEPPPPQRPKAKAPKPRQRRQNMSINDRMAATCPKCGAGNGQPCWKMDTGKPPKPVMPMAALVGDRPYHPERGR